MQYLFQLENLVATEKLAKKISRILKPDFIVALSGNLGAGKTTLTREILRNFGIIGAIKSPTFTLVEPYQLASYTIYHFDLYRFSDPEEWFDCGFDEYFNQPQISFIEWAEKAEGLLPEIDWLIKITIDDEQRTLTINALTNNGIVCLTKLINNAEI